MYKTPKKLILKESNELAPNDVYEQIANCAYTAILATNDIKHIHLHAVGKKFEDVHSTANDYYNKLNDDVDTLCEIALEGNISLDNPTNAQQYVEWAVEKAPEYDYVHGLDAIQLILHKYTEALSDVCDNPNTPSDIVSLFDDTIRGWNKEINYILTRKLRGVSL